MEIKKIIEESFPAYLKLWRDIAAAESPSDCKDGVNRVADLLEDFVAGRGFKVIRIPCEKAGDLVSIEASGDEGTAAVAFLAHMDTVHPVGSFGFPIPKEEDGLLRGPGVYDCKGGIITALMAMEAVMKSEKPHRPMRLLLNSDEESGAWAGVKAEDFLREGTRGCAAALNCESGKKDLMTVGRSGVMHALLKIKGKATHAGNDYFGGASAIREAAYKIIELEKHSVKDEMLFNCGVIRGGKKSNIVPDECEIDVDIRFFRDNLLDAAKEILTMVAEKVFVDGTSCEVEIVHVRPAMDRTEDNLALFDVLKKTAEELGIESPKAITKGGGSDSAYSVQAGVPTVCSLGPYGGGEHTLDEYVQIDSAKTRALLLASAVFKI